MPEQETPVPQPYVLLDVDGVCVDYRGNPMPGVQRLVDTLCCLGYLVVLWSAGGAEYARELAERNGLTVVATHRKPDYPIQLDAALALLGRPPALQVDDDPTERVADWPFMQIDEAAVMVDARPVRGLAYAVTDQGQDRTAADETA